MTETNDSGMRELGAYLYRVQKLMIGLLQKFQLTSPPSQSHLAKTASEEQHFASIQIAANVMLYIRNQVKKIPIVFH